MTRNPHNRATRHYTESDSFFNMCYQTLALANCFALFGALTRQ